MVVVCMRAQSLQFLTLLPRSPAKVGLGLHVVVNLVGNVLGGTIYYESGSLSRIKFTIELPAN